MYGHVLGPRLSVNILPGLVVLRRGFRAEGLAHPVINTRRRPCLICGILIGRVLTAILGPVVVNSFGFRYYRVVTKYSTFSR